MLLLKKWIQGRKKTYIDTFPRDEALINSVINLNRESISKVSNWIDDDMYQKSIFQYGIPDPIKPLIDLELGVEVTYTDFICYFSHFITADIQYLELGVSVGKNFFQLANYFKNATLYGFDIEEINPKIEKFFKKKMTVNWQSMDQSIKKKPSSLSEYEYLNNKIHYLSGDIWDENSWKSLSNQKFNIIFSDALHDPEALKFEYQMIKKYNLLSDKFLFFWDDLVGQMQNSFFHIANDIKNNKGPKNVYVYLVKINGWLGENYAIKHDVGLVTNIKLY